MSTTPNNQPENLISSQLEALRGKGIILWNEGGQLRYRAPKGAMTPEVIALLKAQKSEFLRQIPNSPEPRETNDFGSIKKRPEHVLKQTPLSLSQQRLWFLHQLNNNNDGTYNIPEALRLKGGLNITRLQSTLNHLISKHQALRLRVVDRQQGACQELIDNVTLAFTRVDLTHLSQTDRLAQAMRQAESEANTGFDLETGPLFRAKLIKLGEKDHLFLFTLHHIIADGWSKALLTKDLMSIYNRDDKELGSANNNDIQYMDYAWWQTQQAEKTGFEPHKSYWLEQLKGLPPVMELPLDFPRPKQKSNRGASHFISLDSAQLESLQTLARNKQCSLFMVLLAIYTILLMRYNGRTDVVLGTNVANREQLELENVVGFFVNTLVLRTDLAGNPSFYEVLNRVKSTTLAAFSHQQMPFEKLVEILQPERNLSFEPVVQLMFVMQNTQNETLKLVDLEVSSMAVDRNSAKFDLSLIATKGERGIECEFEYSLDLFSADSIAQLGEHYRNLVSSVIVSPESTIDTFSLTSEQEIKRINQFQSPSLTTDSLAPRLDIISAWRKTVSRYGDQSAVTDGTKTYRYQQLDKISDTVGVELLRQGCSREMIIGLCLGRSADLIAGMLGIIKTGSAFLPLDINHPEQRLKHQISEAKLQFIVTDTATFDRLQPLAPQCKLLCISDLIDTKAFTSRTQSSAEQPTFPEISPQNLAYVIYTSGSTGTPKGSLIEHQNVTNLTQGLHNLVYHRFDSPTCIALLASTIFDASIQQIFGALLQGHKLLILDDAAKHDTMHLFEQFDLHQVALCDCTPSLLRMFLNTDTVQVENLALDYLLVGGEMLQLELVRSFYALNSHTRLINIYGPTECCVDVTAYELHPEQLPDNINVPIGNPLLNSQLYVLDSNDRQQAMGLSGQIAISGQSLGRGYLFNQALTAKSFRYLSNLGCKVYLTGDRGRWLADGTLQLIGRIDRQIKLKGYRIELGEIESQLMLLPEIKAAAVVLHRSESGDELIAYIATDKELIIEKLRQKLTSVLPPYMIPAHFICLEELPLTSSKKVDFKALKAPDLTQRLNSREAYCAPTTSSEIALEKVWCAALGQDRISINDNYFALGGDSIKALQIATRLRAAGLKMEVRQIFEHQNIATLAANLTPLTVNSVDNALAINSNDRLPLSAIQQWFLSSFDGNKNHYNQSLLLTPISALPRKNLARILRVLLNHHGVLRHRFVNDGSTWWQTQRESDAIVSLNFIDQHVLVCVDYRHLKAHEIEAKILADCNQVQGGLNINNGYLFKVVLFELPEQAQRVLFVAHHLICDAVSWRIILADFSHVFQSLESLAVDTSPQPIDDSLVTINRPVANSRQPLDSCISFAQWSLAINRLVEKTEAASEASVLANDLKYWNDREHLRSEYYATNKILETESCLGTYYSTATLDRQTTAQLLSSANECYKTQTVELLITAVLRSLQAKTALPLQLLLEGHGRESLELNLDITRTVGWFTSLYPLCFEIEKQQELSSQIKRVKETLRNVPNHGATYLMLRCLRSNAGNQALSNYPSLPPVAFNYLGQFDNDLANDLFSIASENTGANSDPKATNLQKLEVVAHVLDQQLQLRLTGCRSVFSQAQIDQLSADLLLQIKEVVHFTTNNTVSELTPSDIDFDGFDIDELDSFLDKLS